MTPQIFADYLITQNIDPYDLDELVHDCKAGEAADINNSGLEAQVEYLLKEYSPEELKAKLFGA